MARNRRYEDYYLRQVGGALPVFAGARGQRGHGLGSLFGGLLRSAAPLIKRGAIALGKRTLRTGLHVADDVLSGQNVKKSAKRRAIEVGSDFLSKLLGNGNTPPGIRASQPPRIKRKSKGVVVSSSKKLRRKKTRGDMFSV